MAEKIFRRTVSIGTWLFFFINLYYCFLGKIDTVPGIDDLFMLGTAVIFGVLLYLGLTPECGGKKAQYFFFFYLPIIIVALISLGYYWLTTDNILSTLYKTIRPVSVVRVYAIGILCFLIKSGLFSFKKRYIPVVLSFTVTTMLYPVVEVLLSNDGWTFNIWSVLIHLLMFTLFEAAIMCLLFGFIGENKACRLLIAVAWYVICGYVQTMFLNGNVLMMDGADQKWDIKLVVGNILVWLVIAIIVLFAYVKKKTVAISTINYLLLLITGMQLVAGVTLLVGNMNSPTNQQKQAASYLSSNDLYTVGTNKNIIILVLDVYDTDFLNQALEENPDLLENFDDFVYYPDTVAQFSRTIPSLTYMLTQHEDFQQTPFDDYVDEAFAVSPLWSKMSENDYHYNIYAINNNSFSDEFRRGADNYIEEGYVIQAKYSLEGLYTSFIEIGQFRSVPYLWKNYYLYTQDEINTNIMSEYVLDNPMYNMDDAIFYENICSNGLQLDEVDKRITFIHLNGAHPPYTLSDSSGRVQEGDNTAVSQYIGAINIVDKYMDELKNLGVYDDAMIVVTADHGDNYMYKELEQNTNPILFIKYPGAKGETMSVSNVPVSQEDILCTIASEVDESLILKGYNLKEEAKIPKDRVRYHYYTVVDGTKQLGIVPYEIIGDSQNFNNWKKIDKYIEFLYF